MPVSFLGYKSRASRRVFHATFAAETGAALEAVGLGKYMLAYYCDIMLGGVAQPLESMVKSMFLWCSTPTAAPSMMQSGQMVWSKIGGVLLLLPP